jgi:WD40 repeat protein
VVYLAGDHVAVLDLKTKHETQLGRVDEEMLDAQFVPGHNSVAAAGETGAIKVWDLDRPEHPAFALQGHQGDVNTFALNSDGTRLVSAGIDRTVRLWNLDSRAGEILGRHDLDVSSVMFSPNDRRVLSASKDGTVRLWDVADKEDPITLDSRPGAVFDATISRDGKLIASTGADGVIRIFPCEVCGSLAHVNALADSRPTVRLSRAEERRYSAVDG